ncbi:MAG: phospho-sugar mutase [Bacteroidota bacterium]
MNEQIQQRVETWMSDAFDQDTRRKVERLQREDPSTLADAFYRNLEFGTGGLRGLMGPGTNRMNKYTVGMATQGFANYLNQCFPTGVKVAIAHDSRNNSRFFAETTAAVFAANEIDVYLFEEMRPTPELSFAIRKLGCQAGVVCTASHNPKEYNGYKAYWDDGSQLVSPHDKNVIREVEKIASVTDVKWTGGSERIHSLDAEMDQAYIQMVKELSVFPELIRDQSDLKIVYTPIHGTGIKLVPEVLKTFGFNQVSIVSEQAVPDGNFPTVEYPNPEEPEAMALGLKLAKELDADILCGTDPDADRIAIGVRDHHGVWKLLNGNQTAVLAFNYLIESRRVKGLSLPNDMIVTTIVTTPMIDVIAKGNDIQCYRVLTGFKWIADLIRQKEGKENYIIGGEESFGLMIGDRIRDKDGISAVALLCEMAAVERSKGKSLYQKLIDLYLQYGLFKEKLISITKKGMDGQQQIAEMMEGYRKAPRKQINGIEVVRVDDYLSGRSLDMLTGSNTELTLPSSNVLIFELADGSQIAARPSGTEPKIKFYFSVHAHLPEPAQYDRVDALLEERIDGIIQDMKLKG